MSIRENPLSDFSPYPNPPKNTPDSGKKSPLETPKGDPSVTRPPMIDPAKTPVGTPPGGSKDTPKLVF